MMRWPVAIGVLAIAVAAGTSGALTGCGRDQPSQPEGAAPAPTIVAAAATAAVLSAPPTAVNVTEEAGATGDVHRGRELVVKFECNRCHDGTGLSAPPRDKQCVGCHQDILAGRFQAPAAIMTRWREHLNLLRETPSLEAIGARYRPTWIQSFLLEPHDLRPNLAATMPRLAIAVDQARDLTAYLTQDHEDEPAVDFSTASVDRGRALFGTKQCGGCHAYSGASPAPALTPPAGVHGAIALAPDLRVARERLRPNRLVRWLLDPKKVKPDTLMPTLPMTESEARDLAIYLLNAPLSAEPERRIPERLPVLSRRVSFEEINERLFKKTCRHCHSEPDYALGEGGPGNTGGLGFAPIGLNIGSYAGVAAGMLDLRGERQSVFSPMPDGTPRFVAALLARQAEQAGRPNPAIRGMPLGLPALSPEDIQLVESWVAQGRPL
jgi:cytochrome c5